MDWLLIAVVSNLILGISAVLDKFILEKKSFDSFVYVFWSSILGLFVFILVPWGSIYLSFYAFLAAIFGGFVWFLASFFYFKAVSKSEVSIALPIIGAFAPVFTFIFSTLFLKENLGFGNFIGFAILIFGGFFFFISEKKETRKELLIYTVLGAVFFGLFNVLAKLTFNSSEFIAGVVWQRVGGALAALLFLFLSEFSPFRRSPYGWKNKIARSAALNLNKNSHWKIYPHTFPQDINSAGKTKIMHSSWEGVGIYLLNRGLAAGGIMLLYYAIFLSHPALVDVIGSLKYAVIFLGALFLLKEHFKGVKLFIKIIGVIFVILGISALALINYASSIPYDENREILWGLTFSEKFSRELRVSPKENFEAILNDFNPKKIRLIAYWDEIEKEEGKFDFKELDWFIDKTDKAGAKIILVLGMKVPRWPECNIPSWAKNLEAEERETRLKKYMTEVLNRYKNNGAIFMLQIENEPFLKFGECPKRGENFLRNEIALAREISPDKPVLITDSGEFGLWYKAAQKGDVFGTTMYREVYPPSVGKFTGIINYPISPEFFRFKKKIVGFLTNRNSGQFIVAELQGEPWAEKPIYLTPYEEQIKIFGPEKFRDTINYAKETGFNEYYLWGAESWYALKMLHNDNRMWEEAKKIFVK